MVVRLNAIYTFNPSKKLYVPYHPDHAFIVLDFNEAADRVWMQNVSDPHHVVLKNKITIETMWYLHTQKEIDNYRILYGK